MSRQIIRKIRLAHCKKGPSRCEKCREMDGERICALEIDLADEGLAQRRVIALNLGGETVWREFEIVKVFATREEAAQYAAQHGIKDVEY